MWGAKPIRQMALRMLVGCRNSTVQHLCSWLAPGRYIGPVLVQLASARPIYFRYLHSTKLVNYSAIWPLVDKLARITESTNLSVSLATWPLVGNLALG